MTEQRQASRDQIIMCIHILWERGWEVTIEAIQEMLAVGHPDYIHLQCSPERIGIVSSGVIIPGAKEEWLRNFNWESTWAQEHPRPWPIEQEKWQHQQTEKGLEV